MKIEECHIRQQVRVPNGYEGKIVEIHSAGIVRVDCSPRGYHYLPFAASDIEPVSDPCEGCQKLEQTRLKAFWEGRAAGDIVADKKIASIDESCGYWKAACEEARRNAAYWREELTKWQKEALVDSKPLCESCQKLVANGWNVKCDCHPPLEYGFQPRGAQGDTQTLSEVAKCYMQVAPEELLLSKEARRVAEYISAKGGSLDIDAICDGLKCCMDYLCDHLAEARDAGKIRLVNGKYEIVRD
jgi:hypothetical protein